MFELTLGGKTYQIEPLKRGKSRAIRYKFADAQEKTKNLESLSISDQLRVLDELFDLIFEYSSVLSDDKEYIEEHATDAEIMAAYETIQNALFEPFFTRAKQAKEQNTDI